MITDIKYGSPIKPFSTDEPDIISLRLVDTSYTDKND